mgnify:CR=1 FL=1
MLGGGAVVVAGVYPRFCSLRPPAPLIENGCPPRNYSTPALGAEPQIFDRRIT